MYSTTGWERNETSLPRINVDRTRGELGYKKKRVSSPPLCRGEYLGLPWKPQLIKEKIVNTSGEKQGAFHLSRGIA